MSACKSQGEASGCSTAMPPAPPAVQLAPGADPITVTDAVVTKLTEMLAEQGDSAMCLRIFVSGGGCSGLQYGFSIEDARFKTYGCGSAIASSSLVTEWVKGKTVDEALAIKNTAIAQELALPPVKNHCSILAEDAIKAAVADYRSRVGGGALETEHDACAPPQPRSQKAA